MSSDKLVRREWSHGETQSEHGVTQREHLCGTLWVRWNFVQLSKHFTQSSGFLLALLYEFIYLPINL
jgi:hypothetical protein